MTGKLMVVCFAVGVFARSLSGEDAPKQQVEVTSTERVSFAPGGLIRLNGSYGSLTVEGWDRPEVEITVIKRTQRYFEPNQRDEAMRHLESVRVVTERRSDTEVEISTILPVRRPNFLPPVRRTTKGGATVEYQIQAPRDSRVEIHHGGGYVLLSGLTGDITVDNRNGDIVVMLPDSGSFAIDVKTKMGVVTSDFGGVIRHRHLVGERFARTNAGALHRIHLRIGFGGITIKGVPVEGLRPASKS